MNNSPFSTKIIQEEDENQSSQQNHFISSKDVRLPVQLQRAMAAEAEAAREARAKVIAAEGEHKAAASLKGAADVMSGSSSALQVNA